MNKVIYADYASLTPIDPRVKKTIDRYYDLKYANPSSLHLLGVNAKKEINLARKASAKILGASEKEMFFVNGGTEANNIAILGVVESKILSGSKYSDVKIIISPIEHSSVIEIGKYLKKKGVQVEYLSLKTNGEIDLIDLENRLDEKTVLVSVMYVNNETGIIQPIGKISKIIKRVNDLKSSGDNKIVFHTDASQAFNYLPVNVSALGADIFILDGNKIYGPRSSALMYIKNGTKISPIFYGGEQEGGIRPGTQNLPNICGLLNAMELSEELREKETKRIEKLAEYFVNEIKEKINGAQLNSENSERIPSILNIYIPGSDALYLAFQLDSQGICVSTKSACLSDDLSGSYVLRALGYSEEKSKSSLRISFGRKSSIQEVKTILKSIIKCYNTPQHTKWQK